jgi:Ca2+-binding EF-hand superfamily protein
MQRTRQTPELAFATIVAASARDGGGGGSSSSLGLSVEDLLRALLILSEQEEERGETLLSLSSLSLYECERLVHLLDQDGDGKISRRDFVNSFGGGVGGVGGGGGGGGSDPFRKLRDVLYEKRITVSDFVSILDRNQDGVIDVDEWVVGLADVVPTMSSEEARRLARGLMAGGLGEIDLNALRRRLSDTLFSTDVRWEEKAMEDVRCRVERAVRFEFLILDDIIFIYMRRH